MNAAARVVSGSRKYDGGLTHLLHVELHWLDVPERIKYKLSVTTRRCLSGTAPQYLATHCVPVSATVQLLQGNIFVLLPVISWYW